ncbi:MAG: prepilin-type N-terminal cleavage/methylation domain-containing protein [Kiritimatiellae bacterium]|nr:prepilin-type N-terminal cleavage/methylation domain-containing protein [Kiritimatiellia bacterium]
MKLRDKFKGREGVTLIELLVVILIIVILAVAMLPVLAPFVTRAKYAADGIPAIGNLRTQIQLYFTEKEYLPGLNRTVNGDVLRDEAPTADAMSGRYGTSGLQDQAAPNAVQTGVYGQTLDKSGATYIQSGPIVTKNTKWSDPWTKLVEDDAKNNHFTKDLDISPSDLTGNNVTPDCFVYSAAAGAYKGNVYMYVVGVLGNGEKLKSGTGYAILEVNNSANAAAPRFNATWKRWKPKYKETECSVEQVCMTVVNGTQIDPAKPQDLADHCMIPIELLSTDSNTVVTAMTKLRTAGWEW